MKRLRFLPVAVFVAWTAIGGTLLLLLDQKRNADLRAEALQEAGYAETVLQRQLSMSLSALSSIAHRIESFGQIPDFQTVASGIVSRYGGVSGVLLAPDGVIRSVYPPSAAKRLVGTNLGMDEGRADGTSMVVDGRMIFVTGPEPLATGGAGYSGRLDVYRQKGRERRIFWGTVAVEIRIDDLVAASKADDILRGGYLYEITSTSATGVKAVLKTGESGAPGPVGEGSSFEMPGGRWTVSVTPKDGWSAPLFVFFGAVVVVVGSLLAGFLAFVVVRRTEESRAAATRVLEANVELTRVNEELSRASAATEEEKMRTLVALAALAAREATMRSIVESSDDIVARFDSEGICLYASPSHQTLLGVDPALIVGRCLDDTVMEEGQAAFCRYMIRKAFSSAAPQSTSLALTDRLGEERMFDWRLFPEISPVGVVESVITSARDITARRRYEDALQERESLFRSMFEQNETIKLLIDPKSGQIVDANAAACRFYGMAKTLLVGAATLMELSAETEETVREEIRQAVSLKSTVFRSCHRTASGENRDVEVYGGPLDTGGKTFLFAVVIDVTDRERAFEALKARSEQLAFLSSEISLTEERERRRIATELHDRVGHTLTLVKMRLEASRKAQDAETHEVRLDEVRRYADQAIREIRTLTTQLSPPMLYEFGLEAAISTLAEAIQEDFGIWVDVVDEGAPDPPDEETRLILFHAVRELLFNVGKHAAASSATVTLSADLFGRIVIEVADDGRGFAPSAFHPGAGSGFGLFNVRQRVSRLGGEMEVVSAPGAGTTIRVRGPHPTGVS